MLDSPRIRQRNIFSSLLRIFLYLQRDADRELTLGAIGPHAEQFSIATDSSHEEGPSLTGVFVIMGSAVIDWICRRQKFTTRNSTAAEAMANAEVCLSDMEPQVAECFLHFLYTGRVKDEVWKDDDAVCHLLSAGHKYEVTSLVESCVACELHSK